LSDAVPIHYERRDDHVVVITIDRPESRNSLDLYHFRDLAKAWKDFRYDDEAWVAIVTGVDGNFMSGADLKTYIPQITELAKEISKGAVAEIDGCRSSPPSTVRASPAAWRCWAAWTSASPPPAPRSG